MGTIPMGDLSRWKAVAILASTLVVCVAAVPNVLPNSTFERLPAWAQRKIMLSYDLQGGSRAVFAVDRDAMRREQLQELREDARRTLRLARVGFVSVPVIHERSIEVRVREADFDLAVTKLRELAGPSAAVVTGAAARQVDLADVPAGSASLTADRRSSTVTPTLPDFFVTARDDGRIILTPTDATMDERIEQGRLQAMFIAERRLLQLGVDRFSIEPQGLDRVLIEAPGVYNIRTVKY
jgi:preprotein translocase subunit SecD